MKTFMKLLHSVDFYGLRFRLILLGFVPAALAIAFTTTYFLHNQAANETQAQLERGNLLIQQLAYSCADGILNGNTSDLQRLLDDIGLEHDVVFVKITDSHNQTLARAGNFTESEGIFSFTSAVVIPTLPKPQISAEALDTVLLEYEPPKVIGHVHLGVGKVTTTSATQMLFFSLLFLIVLFFIIFRLANAFGAPIKDLNRITRELALGNLTPQTITTRTTEFANLSRNVNTMVHGIQNTQNHLLNQLNKAVDELSLVTQALEEKNIKLELTTRQAVTQNANKSRFLAQISHEIRTPMSGIIGFSDLLIRSNLSVRQKEQAALIKSSATNLLTIVNEILDEYSLETGQFKIQNVYFPLRECIEDCVCSLIPYSENVQIVLDFSPQVPEIIYSDPIRIRQIIYNLVGNACKFTQQGYIIVRCSFRHGEKLYVSVADTGCGISDARPDKVFQPYLSISDARLNTRPGNGLGLSITKTIIENLGGDISLKSRPGTGSVFRFFIPTERIEHRERNHNELLACVIDPSAIRRKALAHQLTFLGYTCRTFRSIDDLANATTADVVLSVIPSSVQLNEYKRILSSHPSVAGAKKIFLCGINPFTKPPEIINLPCRSSHLKLAIDGEPLPLPNLTTSFALESAESENFPILIADDHEINRALLKAQVEKFTCNITLAADGKETLELLKKHKYYLVLLDLQMPYLNGDQILAMAKKQGLLNADTPFIAITASMQKSELNQLIDAGFDACLIKPVTDEQLYELISLWKKSPSEREYTQLMLEKTSFDKTLSKTLFEKLFQELPSKMSTLSRLVNEGELEEAEKIAHQLHGLFSFCGFKKLAQAAKHLESHLHHQQTALAEQSYILLKRLTDELLQLERSILDHLDE